MTTQPITLNGREFHVSCSSEEVEVLQEAVTLLDSKVTRLAKKTRNTGERLIVMAALELARDISDIRRRLNVLGTQLDKSA